MRKKKVLGMMLSFTLAFGLALPATMAMPLESTVKASDSNASDSNASATGSNVTATVSNATATDSNAIENVIVHIVTCVEGCAGEFCECVCHVPSLFERFMQCENLENIWILMDSVSDEELASLTDEQWMEIDLLIEKLIPEVPEDEPVELTIESEPTVESSIIYPTVSFTNVAPFGVPVTGKVE